MKRLWLAVMLLGVLSNLGFGTDTDYFWVNIPMESRSDWEDVAELITPDQYTYSATIEMNSDRQVFLNDVFQVLLPLTVRKGTYLYPYTIQKGDTVADLSYLFYEDYNYTDWLDYNSGLSASDWEIEEDDTLYVNFPIAWVSSGNSGALATESPIIPAATASTAKAASSSTSVTTDLEPESGDYWVSIIMEKRTDWENVVEEILENTYNADFYIEKTYENNFTGLVQQNNYVMLLLPVEYMKGDYFYVYEIEKGDILSDISYLFYEDYRYKDILKYNELASADMIKTGDDLYIPLYEDNIIALYQAVESDHVYKTEPAKTTTKTTTTAIDSDDYWVEISMERRSDWENVIENILENTFNSDYYVGVSVSANDYSTVKQNDAVLVMMPLIYDSGKYFFSYEVEKGEILSDISYLFYEDYLYKDILQYNDLESADLIEAGSELLIPISSMSVQGSEMKTVSTTLNTSALTVTSVGGTNFINLFVTNYFTNVVVEIVQTADMGLASELEVELIRIPVPAPTNMIVTTNRL